MNGHPTERLPGNLSISVLGVDSDRLLTNLDGIAVSSGSACTSNDLEPSHVLTAMGIDRASALSTIRFGLGRFTTDDEIEFAIEAMIKAVRASRIR